MRQQASAKTALQPSCGGRAAGEWARGSRTECNGRKWGVTMVPVWRRLGRCLPLWRCGGALAGRWQHGRLFGAESCQRQREHCVWLVQVGALKFQNHLASVGHHAAAAAPRPAKEGWVPRARLSGGGPLNCAAMSAIPACRVGRSRWQGACRAARWPPAATGGSPAHRLPPLPPSRISSTHQCQLPPPGHQPPCLLVAAPPARAAAGCGCVAARRGGHRAPFHRRRTAAA